MDEKSAFHNFSSSRFRHQFKVPGIISGTFFVCAAPPDSDRFEGLTDQQVKTYTERFAMPEMFLDVGGDLFVLPYL